MSVLSPLNFARLAAMAIAYLKRAGGRHWVNKIEEAEQDIARLQEEIKETRDYYSELLGEKLPHINVVTKPHQRSDGVAVRPHTQQETNHVRP